MNPMNAKMQSLDRIIDLMDNRMLGAAKKKGAPVEPPVAAPQAADIEIKVEQPASEMDAEAERQLMELYEGSDEPANVNAEP